jgi:hypothetical protein
MSTARDRGEGGARQDKSPEESVDEINDRIADLLREQAEREVRVETGIPKDNSTVVRALGMLAEASRWFRHKGWKTLPNNRRGWLIVQWGAEVAWQGNPANPERGARAWCCKWQPLLKLKQNKTKLDRIIAEAAGTKTLWAPDIGGATLEITVSDLVALGFRFLGACDDQNYDARNAIRRAKNAACQRRRRAANSSGRKRGRPALNLSPEEKRTRRLAQEAERKRRARASAKNASSHIESITAVTELMRTRPIALDLDGFNPAKFGIVGIMVMSGTDVLRSWERAGPSRRSEAPVGVIR